MSERAILNKLAEAILELDLATAKAVAEAAVKTNIATNKIVANGIGRGAELVSKRYEAKEYFLPELIMAGEVMKAVLDIIKPKIIAERAKPIGKVVIGTVRGDLHDIGKNVVIAMLLGAGFEIHDLGTDVPPEKFVMKVKEVKPNILGMSALLTTTMPEMSIVVNKLKEAGLRDCVKIMVGGRPITPEFALEIGADAYARDALEAVKKAKKLVAKES
jgi:5-methyltetrahydrofolate--homocysteine methyltransferase